MNRILLSLLIVFPLFANAQFQIECVDSNRANPFYRCNDPTFDPICGCDNVTYRNNCEMTNAGGVNFPSQFQNGVCRNDFYFFNITPNPATEKLDFNMRFAEQEKAPATIQIINSFGNVMYSQLLNNIADFATPPQFISLNNLDTGVYLFVVQSQGVFKIKKFLKVRF